MNAKQYLKRIEKLDILIEQKGNEINNLRGIFTSVISPDFSEERVASGVSRDASFVNPVLKVTVLEAEVKDLEDEMAKIIRRIRGLEDVRHVNVLYKRYVEFKSLVEIAVDMKYSYDYMRRLHGRALSDFERSHIKSHKDTQSPLCM